MDKTALKKFAIQMRRELISNVQRRVDFLLSSSFKDNLAHYQSKKEDVEVIAQRYEKEGEVFIEEVAYTWFNRLIALRFMDIHQVTDSFVISTTDEQPIPQLFVDAKSGEIDDDLVIDKKRFYDLIDRKIAGIKDSDNEAYKMLFIATCNSYADVLPTMFEKISDYTELLLPEDMLSPNSIRAKVVSAMRKEDCSDIEVIGWLYQFYISEKKDDVFALLKKNKKITSENIPAATQLFTPHWIVKYMVENTLGKIWMQNHPNSTLKEKMRYYIESEEQDTPIMIDSVEELTLLDPCCGSGHTLTYAFDLLSFIYEEQGYSRSEIPSLILQNNLFGCDIDKRAATLANFALTMKARLYHKRFFKKEIQPNIVELREYHDMQGVKNFGSLVVPHSDESFDDGIFSQKSREYTLQKKILSEQFHALVTNPPYMGSKGMNKELSDFVKKRYPDSKSDLFAVFMERTLEMTKEHGYMSMINQHSWMFLSSYEKLRKKIIENHKIDTLVHLGARAFEEIGGEVVQSVAFVLQKDGLEIDDASV